MEYDPALPRSPREAALLHEHFAYFVSLAEVSVLNDAEDDLVAFGCPDRIWGYRSRMGTHGCPHCLAWISCMALDVAWRSKAADFHGIYVEGWLLSDVFLDWLVQQGEVIPDTGKTKYDDMMASMGDGDKKHAFKTIVEKCAPNVK